MPRGSSGRLHGLATLVCTIGLAASLALMSAVGRSERSTILMILFALWVGAPFAALLWIGATSSDRPSRRTAFDVLALIIVAVSVATYAVVAFGPPRPQPAKFFLLVPAASWLVMSFAAAATRRN